MQNTIIVSPAAAGFAAGISEKSACSAAAIPGNSRSRLIEGYFADSVIELTGEVNHARLIDRSGRRVVVSSRRRA